MKVVGDAAGRRRPPFAGNGCRDTTRLAGSSATVWQSILATNAEALEPLLLALADQLRDAAGALDDGDRVPALFDAGKRVSLTLERSR